MGRVIVNGAECDRECTRAEDSTTRAIVSCDGEIGIDKTVVDGQASLDVVVDTPATASRVYQDRRSTNRCGAVVRDAATQRFSRTSSVVESDSSVGERKGT